MTTSSSDHSRATLVATLDLLEKNRTSIERGLARHAPIGGSEEQGRERSATMSASIVGMMLDYAHWQVGSVESLDSRAKAPGHEALGMTAEDYSRFGDALQPVLRDTLGRLATPSMLAAWGDAYWKSVRTSDEWKAGLAA